MTFTFIDLFSGIGGFRLALSHLGGDCLFSSDIDENCRKSYQANYGELPFGDITKINPKEIPEHDILCGGFPCQPFSVSGKQLGFEDARGTLFFNILEIIKEKKTKIVFLENVANLRTHDKGKTLKVIVNSLEELGYNVSYKVMNAKDFGVPQNRERIIIIASKKGYFDFNLIEKKEEKNIKDILETSGDFDYLIPEEYTILDKSLWKRQKSGLIFCGYRNKSIRTKGARENTEHLSRVHKQPNRIYHIDGVHPTIPSQETAGRFWIYDNKSVRKLTINECFRLQGFPNNFIKVGTKGKLYNQIGNSVAVPMMEAIGSSIISQFLSSNIN